MNEQANPIARFDWRVVAISVALVIGQGLIQWGITSATLLDHARRLDGIERRMEERSMTRDEYERRHDDLARQVETNRQSIRELEKKAR